MTQPLVLTTRLLEASQPGPRLLITAGVHGDEYEPMVAVRALAQEFSDRLLRGAVTLVPVVNQPAFQRARRTGDDELDLARVCPGSDDGSPTQRIAAALSRLIGQADYYLDLHTAGSHYQIFPLCGYTLHADEDIRDMQRRMARAFNLPLVWGTTAGLEGRTLSVARDAGVPAIYAEYGGGGPLNSAAIEGLIAGCLNVAAALNLIEPRQWSPQMQYWVEDDRPGAGHLQVQYPAPCDGFFEPAVCVGQVVREGQLLGTITDVLGIEPVECRSREAGLVIFQRVVPSVCEGDALLATVPITEPGTVRLGPS